MNLHPPCGADPRPMEVVSKPLRVLKPSGFLIFDRRAGFPFRTVSGRPYKCGTVHEPPIRRDFSQLPFGIRLTDLYAARPRCKSLNPAVSGLARNRKSFVPSHASGIAFLRMFAAPLQSALMISPLLQTYIPRFFRLPENTAFPSSLPYTGIGSPAVISAFEV